MKTPNREAVWPLIPMALAGLALFAGATVAQEPIGVPERAREARVMIQARAQLGVLLGEAERVGDRTGVRIRQVVPGGPAARAGVQADDVILTLNGQVLGEEPARQVTTIMAGVSIGDTVPVVVDRAGHQHVFRVVTDRPRSVILGPGIEAGTAIIDAIGDLRPALVRLGRHRLELVDMNPGLGRYFDAREGVLVVDVAADSPLGLQPGDVILAIDGRTVRDRGHVHAILGSYRGDEAAEIRLVRDRRTITVRATPGTR